MFVRTWCRMAVFGVTLAACLVGELVSPRVAEAGLSVSFVFQNHQRNLTSRQLRRLRYYHRRGCRVFSLSQRQQRFALRSLSHAFTAMNDKRFRKIVRGKRFTYTHMSGSSILRKIQMRHRSLPVFGYYSPNCPVSHTATAFAIYGMIFLRSTYLNRVIRTNNWRRLAQTLAHEWMHGVGFGHGRNGGQGTQSKRNSVPIYIGCLVKYFPKLAHGKQVCARAKYRYRNPYLARRYRRRYRAPKQPFYPHLGRRGSGNWLDGKGARRDGDRAPAPFRAPTPPKGRSLGDWLDGD